MRVKRSSILNHFHVKSNIAICKKCSVTLKSDRTNNLKTHLVRIHKIAFTELDKKIIAAKTFKVKLSKEGPIKSVIPPISISEDARLAELTEDFKTTNDFADITTSQSSMDPPSISVTLAHEKAPKRLKLNASNLQKPLEKSHTVSGTLNQPTSVEENEYDCFGKSIGCQLKKLPESVAQQSMARIQSYLVKQRLKVIERQFEAPFANDSDLDDSLH